MERVVFPDEETSLVALEISRSTSRLNHRPRSESSARDTGGSSSNHPNHGFRPMSPVGRGDRYYTLVRV